ncbi:MAG TPA: cyclic nucleotide-binding domain-containing protein [Elusimicrobiota bacterium]|jgi:CRP-like cAMP-binding protein|nr:cyclic nucleotide-binding domain-containing protein [Elusimicrobiota bacterium]
MLRFLKRWFTDPAFSRKKQFLQSLELFSGLKGGEIGALVHALHARTYRPGEVIFMEGDIGRALFIMESGRVELTRRGADGQPVVLYTLKPGEFFGEMALLESLPRSATATAAENTRLHLLYRTKLDALLQSEPRIGVSIMGHLARLLSARLRRVSGELSAFPSPHA